MKLNQPYRNTWILVLIVLCSALPRKGYAQQTPLYTQSYINPYLYNPAYAGDSPSPAAYFLYRKQWVGVNGAPETQIFTLDGSLKNQPVGLGVTFFNDVTNIIGRTGGAVSGSYKANIRSNQSIRFGLSFLVVGNKIFFDRIKADDLSDPNILKYADQRTAFDCNGGAVYTLKKLKIGFSAEQLIQNTFEYNNEALFQTLNYTLVRHYYTTAEYQFEPNPNVTITPRLLVRSVQGLRSEFDGNVLIDYKKIVWTNLMYRHQVGAGVALGFALDDQFVFGYSYEFPTTDLNILGGTTHEVLLGIRLRRSQEGKSLKSTEALKREYENAIQYEKMDAIAQQNEQVQGKLQKAEQKLQTQNEELERLREVIETYRTELDKTMEVLGVTQGDSAAVGDRFYVVVGALRSFDNAKSFQRILKREAGLDTKIVQSASKTWYFIYSNEADSFNEAAKYLETIRKSAAMPFIIEEPWIYKEETE